MRRYLGQEQAHSADVFRYLDNIIKKIVAKVSLMLSSFFLVNYFLTITYDAKQTYLIPR